MVLSNKKLKQKLRSLLAESAATTESKKSLKGAASEDVNQQLQSIKELLRSKSRKPRFSKREKRREKAPFSEDSKPIQEGQETESGNGDNVVDSVGLKKEEKSKKRKREGEGEDKGSAEKKSAKQNKQKKKKKNKNKRKEEKKEKQREKNEKGTDNINGARSAKDVEVSVKIDESETKKVYVGGIPYYSSEDDIRSFFEGCGTVTEVDCMKFPESGRFRGIALLTFKTEAAAKRALALDGADMGGFYLKIQPYKAKRAQKSDFAPDVVEGYNRVYVGNLSWDTTEDDLKQLFSDCKVSTVRFGMDKESGEFKGYAHVDFSDSVSLAIALKLDQKVVCGRPVRIRCAVPKKGGVINSGKKPDGNKAENSSSAGNLKKRRRTCYECGVPGHISSDCPRKKAAEMEGSAAKS